MNWLTSLPVQIQAALIAALDHAGEIHGREPRSDTKGDFDSRSPAAGRLLVTEAASHCFLRIALYKARKRIASVMNGKDG